MGEDGAMLACCHQGHLRQRRPECNAPENRGCHGLAGLCCPHGDGAMLACCHQGSSSSSLVDAGAKWWRRRPECNSADNPGCHGLAGLCCPHEDGAMLACCHQGRLRQRPPSAMPPKIQDATVLQASVVLMRTGRCWLAATKALQVRVLPISKRNG